MSYTMQQIVDLARVPLNDAAKARYSDDEMLGHANAAVRRTYELRPDLLIGTSFAPFATLPLTDPFPLPDRFAQPLADYVGGRAELKDDEAASLQRSNQLLSMYVAEITG